MALSLFDLRQAMLDYLAAQVVATVSPPVPDTPPTLGVGEGFTFGLAVVNAPPTPPIPAPPIPFPSPGPGSARAPIQLINVRYHLSVVPFASPALALRLIVPPATVAAARPVPVAAGPTLAPGTPVGEMYLVSAAPEGQVLAPGEAFALPGLRGTVLAPGNALIRVRVLADADLDFLFPKNGGSAEGGTLVQVP